MANGGSLGRTEKGAWDPSQALTVAEAARLVGSSEAALRRRIQSGELLHEVGRRGGRDVQLVRLVDLLDAYPDLLVPGEAAPEVDAPAGAPAGAPREPAAGEAPTTRVAASAAPRVEERAATAAEEARAEDAAVRRQNHAFEVRLASMQAANEALSGQVRDLQVQRGDLREQCSDLRVRLTSVEKERQASTAGLLMAQRRLLEIEAHALPFVVPAPWWRRGTTWVALALFVVLAYVAQRQARGGRELEELHGLVAPALARAAEDRALLAQEVERRRVAFEASLTEVREEGQASRSALLGQLQQLVTHAEKLSATLDAQRATAREEREALEAELAATRREAELARRALEEERELRTAAAREEERQRALLDERIADLAEQVRAGGASAARLGEQLVARDSAWQESLARLTAELAELQERRRLEDQRARERARAKVAAARWCAAWFWGFLLPEPTGPATVDDA